MATGTFVRPGATNTYVRNHDATGNLIVSFSRAISDFPLPKYVQYRPVKKTTGLYLRIKPENCARIVNSNLEDFVWPDGADAPKMPNMSEFKYEDYRTERFLFPWQLGYKTRNEADWPLGPVNKEECAQQAMTGRTQLVVNQLETTGNWDASHILDVTSLDGADDSWENSTSSDQFIKNGIGYGAQLIHKATFGRVKIKDLQLVMNPTTARRIGKAQEIVDFVKQQASAPGIMSYDDAWILEQYGLPAKLYGVNPVIEDTVVVTSRYGASTTTSEWAMSDGEVFLLARPGAIEASAGGGPSFSTMTLFLLEEMTVEERDDPDNRRYDGRIIEDYDSVMTAPVSGVWFRNTIEAASS